MCPLGRLKTTTHLLEREKKIHRLAVTLAKRDLITSLHILRQAEEDPERYGKLETAIRLIEAGEEAYEQALGAATAGPLPVTPQPSAQS